MSNHSLPPGMRRVSPLAALGLALVGLGVIGLVILLGVILIPIGIVVALIAVGVRSARRLLARASGLGQKQDTNGRHNVRVLRSSSHTVER